MPSLDDLGLNRMLVKESYPSAVYDPTLDTTEQTDNVIMASLLVKDAKALVSSGGSTFDVTQTADYLRNKTLYKCVINDSIDFYGIFGNGFLQSGMITPVVTVNGFGINIETVDQSSGISIFEGTSRYESTIFAGNVSVDVFNDTTTRSVTVVGGLLNLPQLTSIEIAAITPQNGSMCYDTTNDLPKIYVAGVWKTISYS